jgi:hypothetical protein
MLSDLKFTPFKGAKLPKQFQIWSRIRYDQVIPVVQRDLFTQDSGLFVLGSCFANEIRAALDAVGIKVYPAIDPELKPLVPDAIKQEISSWGEWDERVHYQCYTPCTLQQEVNVALGHWLPEDEAVYEGTIDGQPVYWDMYRRGLYANSREDLLAIRRKMNENVRDGLEKADAVVMTLGLAEAQKLKNFSGYASELNPAFLKELEFENLSYDQVLAILTDICDKIFAAYPSKKIIFSISPIPLNRTFTGDDVVTATTRAKCMLRTAADAVAQKYDNVYYWPSYEYVMWSGRAFCADDIRHIRPEIVNEITEAFCRGYFSEEIGARVGANKKVSNDGLGLKARGYIFLRKMLNVFRRKLAASR